MGCYILSGIQKVLYKSNLCWLSICSYFFNLRGITKGLRLVISCLNNLQGPNTSLWCTIPSNNVCVSSKNPNIPYRGQICVGYIHLEDKVIDICDRYSLVDKQRVCYKHTIIEALSQTNPFPPIDSSIVDNNKVGQPQKID